MTLGSIYLQVELPLYVRSEANNRDSRFVKAKRAQQQRFVAGAKLKGMAAGLVRVVESMTGPQVLIVTLTRIYKHTIRPLDDDNLRSGFKAVRDGVADALGIDDGSKRLRFEYAQEPGRDYAVRIEIASREARSDEATKRQIEKLKREAQEDRR